MMNNKLLFLVSAIFLALPAQADIFKCKDGKGKIIYQQSPCPEAMVGKVGRQQDPSLEDQIDAQNRTEQMKDQVRQYDAIEAARREQGSAARREWAEKQRQFALDQEAERKQQEKEKAEAREKRRSKRMHCRPDGVGGMFCN